LVQSPLDIARAMEGIVGLLPQPFAGRRAWVFTSATLGHDAGLDLFVQSCGLAGARVVQIESPFNYASQSALYVPLNMPKPADAAHSAAVAKLVIQAAIHLGGRTMVLTTTLRAMRSIGDDLRRAFAAGSDAALTVLVQGEASKRELVDRFNQGATKVQAGCILVASTSFWEGIDIPGDALQLLVIDKLPFAPPDDPLQQARAAQLESIGKSAFKEMHLPQAALALKQGAGRLIRRETDRGVLVVCDTRLAQMGYGKKIVKALPPMRRLHTEEDFLATLDDVTRLSTMGSSSSLHL
jgi:ATP-dependent DNA helicase DinG